MALLMRTGCFWDIVKRYALNYKALHSGIFRSLNQVVRA
ncbi:protein of unknown function (plasmid) [Shinella sp. WSC3-e]|nr:hypothetical protein SHINE37_70022 [Rhizobiaceae bacterium]CAK7260860.1 protein of unknown function [Shinella sp. WSC3-e]